MTISRKDIYLAAREWVGTPFRHQGRTKNGIDCLGLIWVVGRAVGVELSLPNDYSSAPSGQALLAGAKDRMEMPERQGFDRVTIGDVVISWGWQDGIPQHFSIVGELYGRPSMIHAFERAGGVVEHGVQPIWKKRYVGTFCFPGTEKLEDAP
jgi:cell wall-associated NlpC family hydrolase